MDREVLVTGGGGRLGRVVVARLLAAGWHVRSVDWAKSWLVPRKSQPGLKEIRSDLKSLDRVIELMRGCQAVIHLAAYPGPDGPPPGEVYANNTLTSYNVLQAASTLGLRHVCLASSVNALGGIGSRVGRFDYFPVDELHPTHNADDYSLSKWVLEQQADSFARRFPQMTISSLRFHALIPDKPELQHSLDTAEAPVARGLWGWTNIDEGARACELALEADFRGHEAFFIIAPTTISAIPTRELAAHAYPSVPIRRDLPGNASFFDCSKAARLLGWTHFSV